MIYRSIATLLDLVSAEMALLGEPATMVTTIDISFEALLVILNISISEWEHASQG